MTHQITAAQAAMHETTLTDSDVREIAHDWDCFFRESSEGSSPLCIRDIERRVLSKLRAFVADDRAKDAFESMWREINGLASWQANPWVWVLEFRRVR